MRDFKKIGRTLVSTSIIVTTMVWSVGLMAWPSAASAAACPQLKAGQLVRFGNAKAQVSYIGSGNRWSFINNDAFVSWRGTAAVKRVDATCSSSYPEAGVIGFRPGSRLVMNTGAGGVFAVGPNNILHKLSNSAAAKDLYSAGWQGLVSKLTDTQYNTLYTVGSPLDGSAAHDGMLVKKKGDKATWYVWGGELKMINGKLPAFLNRTVRTVAPAKLASLAVSSGSITAAAITADPTQGKATASSVMLPSVANTMELVTPIANGIHYEHLQVLPRAVNGRTAVVEMAYKWDKTALLKKKEQEITALQGLQTRHPTVRTVNDSNKITPASSPDKQLFKDLFKGRERSSSASDDKLGQPVANGLRIWSLNNPATSTFISFGDPLKTGGWWASLGPTGIAWVTGEGLHPSLLPTSTPIVWKMFINYYEFSTGRQISRLFATSSDPGGGPNLNAFTAEYNSVVFRTAGTTSRAGEQFYWDVRQNQLHPFSTLFTIPTSTMVGTEIVYQGSHYIGLPAIDGVDGSIRVYWVNTDTGEQSNFEFKLPYNSEFRFSGWKPYGEKAFTVLTQFNTSTQVSTLEVLQYDFSNRSISTVFTTTTSATRRPFGNFKIEGDTIIVPTAQLSNGTVDGAFAYLRINLTTKTVNEVLVPFKKIFSAVYLDDNYVRFYTGSKFRPYGEDVGDYLSTIYSGGKVVTFQYDPSVMFMDTFEQSQAGNQIIEGTRYSKASLSEILSNYWQTQLLNPSHGRRFVYTP